MSYKFEIGCASAITNDEFLNYASKKRNQLVSPEKDLNIEPKVTDRVDAVSKAGASKLTREVNNERFKYYIGVAD